MPDFARLDDLYGMGSNGVSGRVSQKESALEARAPTPDMPPNRHIRLALPEPYQGTDRYRQASRALLAKLDDALCALPSGVPFDVQLQLPGDADQLTPAPAIARMYSLFLSKMSSLRNDAS